MFSMHRTVCQHPGANPAANDSSIVSKWTPVCPRQRPGPMSILAQQFFHEKGVNWWLIPPESPDCNPIENLWHELKEHLRREVKPRNKLIQGIVTLWEIVDVTKYCKYINHLAEVLPKVFECEGGCTGY